MKTPQAWTGCVRAALLCGALLAAGSSAAQDRDVWITLGSEQAEKLQAALARRGAARALAVESQGELVVARIAEARVPLLARVVHEELRRCGGFVAHASRDEAYEAVAREAALEPQQAVLAYTLDNAAVVNALLPGIQEANVRNTISTLAAYFTRYHTTQTGQDSANWIRDLWQGYAQGRPDVTVQLFAHPSSTTPQPSVILTIPGSSLPSEIVVLGAHQDSINGGASGRAPGADDDASGVASLSEVVRVALAQGYRPLRTVKFMAYAAEEVGLRGSNDIATQHKNAGANVVGVLQLDMTNYKGTATADIVLVTDRTNAAQNTFVGQLVDTYLGLSRTTTQCGYGCSDHASWNTQGYPASFPLEATFDDSNPNIHTANDTLAQSGGTATHAVKFSKLAAAYMAEVAKGTLGTGGNLPPVANAGPDQGVSVGAVVTLDGRASSDPDSGPSPLAYAWSQTAGPSVTLGNPNAAQPTFTASLAGSYTFQLTVSDGAASASDLVQVAVTDPGGGQLAAFDAALQALKCGTVGASCDSGAALLLGRGPLGPEPNQPNTLADACADGTSGGFHVDESNDRLKVATTDGTAFAAGKTVRVEATVWAYSSFASDKLDLYYAANALSPAWTLIATLSPSVAGAQTLSTTYTLPAGALQAVRAQFRYQGTSAACASGAYSDRDDLVFAVSSSPVTTVWSDTFETSLGWTTNPNGTDTATLGAWERGDPEATNSSGTKQLGTTVSGANDLVTARLAGASAGANDVDGGTTSIQSPPIALPASGTLTLAFQYYLAHGSNASNADFFRASVVAGGTATQVFQSLGAATNRDAAWTPVSVSLNAFAGQTVRIRFEAADAASGSLVEAGVDDVSVTQQ